MKEAQAFGHEEVAAWLRAPDMGWDEPIEQDWDVVMADCLEGGLPGHIAFYLNEDIPSERRREFLLNALYVMAWTRFQLGDLDALPPGLEAARASSRAELIRWADSVEKHVASGLKPNYAFWCDWGWTRPGVPEGSLDLGDRIRRFFGGRNSGRGN